MVSKTVFFIGWIQQKLSACNVPFDFGRIWRKPDRA